MQHESVQTVRRESRHHVGVSEQKPDRSLGGRLRRATPRVVYVAVVVAGVAVSRGWLFYVWLCLSVGIVFWAGHGWASWWEYVTTGLHPIARPADWLRSGDFDVVLESPGSKRIQVIKHIRDVAGLDLVGAKAMVDEPPSVVVRSVSRGSAERAKGLLESAGASVALRPSESDL
jgi:hypothetical protein